MKCNKLVRDNIVKIIEAQGRSHTSRVLFSDVEYEAALVSKLREEVEEFIEDPCKEEMADILEVLDCLMEFYSIDPYAVETAKQAKAHTRGSFKKRIYLEEVTDK